MGGGLVEFQPADFAGREWLPGSQWPVQYEEIAPFYRLSYENLGLRRETHDDAAVWRSVSSKCPRLGDQFEVFLTRFLKVPNLAIMYSQQYENSEAFSVLITHTVVGFQGSGGRITSVRVSDSFGKKHSVQGDTFILAAGTVENARLLLHAAADTSWKCPWRHNPNIGRYFHDHVGGTIATVQPRDKRKFVEAFSPILRHGQKYQPKFRLRSGILLRDRILNIQGIFGVEHSASENLADLKRFVKTALYSGRVNSLGHLFRNAVACSHYLAPLARRYFLDHRIFVPVESKISLVIQAEQRPVAESRLTLDLNSVDVYGLPRVVLDWKLSGDEQQSFLEFARRADVALRGEGLASLKIDEDLQAMNPRFLATLRDTNHQAGGTVMGWSERDGVVDRNLRVFGTTNLYVAGASTFRTVSSANVTFTAIAFTTRLVSHLCGEHLTD